MEVFIGQEYYRVGKLNAFKQLHIVRRLSPCLGKLAGLANMAGSHIKLKKDAEGKVVDFEGDIAVILTPLTEAISALKDEDTEYILNACLEVTERKQAGNNWVPVRVNKTTMFSDISLPVMLQIAYYVIRENLTDFFSALPPMPDIQGFMKSKGLLG